MITKKHELYLCAILLLASVGSFFVVHGPAQADGLLHIYFLNVGQGDSILIQAPDGTQILIDGGPGSRVVQELGSVLPIGDRSLDAIIATHTDADHITGLVEVLKQYEVGRILETGMSCVTVICSQWEREASAEGSPRTIAQRGYRVSLGDEFILEVVSPAQSVKGQTLSKTNNGAIVLKLRYKNQTALFTGDIEKKVEDELLRDGIALDVDFLKVAHHGSKTQSFLEAVSPLIAFIQVGSTNRYGHPAPPTIERLEKFPGLVYYRTDIHGRIELLLDGLNYAVKTEQSPQ
jgi:competence protein ComEC